MPLIPDNRKLPSNPATPGHGEEMGGATAPTSTREKGDANDSNGIQGLADELVPLFYGELRRLAHHARQRSGSGATLQTTALVHEAYLKLRHARPWNDDAHFLRAASLAMRHALVNHAEANRASKRGSGAKHVNLDAALDIAAESDERILAVHEALNRLEQEAPRLVRVVECRYFGGCSEPETARALGMSERTVRRDWTLARAWLYRELEGAA